MKIYLELNQRFKTGYQVRIVSGPMDKTYDAVEWIRQTYARHVKDDRTLIQYILS